MFKAFRDTVSAVGVLYSPDLPFVSNNHAIRVFRHAISLDEHRIKYAQNLWHRHAGVQSKAKHDRALPAEERYVLDRRSSVEPEAFSPLRPPTDVREVWFAGCHSGSFSQVASAE